LSQLLSVRPSVCLSLFPAVLPVRTLNSKTKRRIKPKLSRTFPTSNRSAIIQLRSGGRPHCMSAQGRHSKIGACRMWLAVDSAFVGISSCSSLSHE